MIEEFVYKLVFNITRLPANSKLGQSAAFFFYDTIKIFIMLSIIIFLVTFVRSFFPPEKIKKYLHNRYEFLGNVLAALFGIITPFCTCSAIPLFMGFLESGVPLGVTFSYLISAPTVNEIALGLLWVLFGWKIALLYIATGLSIAIISGYVIGRLHLEHLVEEFVYETKAVESKTERPSLNERTLYAYQYMISILKKVWLFIIIGVGLGALIHGYVPVSFVLKVAGPGNPLAVPVAVLIGVPLYSNVAGSIPIIQALIAKGLPIGTALALMMSITAISAPELLILRRVMKTKLLAIFVGIVAGGIVTIGYLFNMIL